MTGRTRTWSQLLVRLRAWLRVLKRETVADLWESVRRERAGFEAMATSVPEGAPISDEGRAHIAARLDGMHSFLQNTTAITSQQLSAVENEIGYLRSAARRLGWRDWYKLTIGALVGLMLDRTLTPEIAREAWRWLAAALDPIVDTTTVLLH